MNILEIKRRNRKLAHLAMGQAQEFFEGYCHRHGKVSRKIVITNRLDKHHFCLLCRKDAAARHYRKCKGV